MKIAEYKQVSTNIGHNEILIPEILDEHGNVLVKAHVEVITTNEPVMGIVYREMTAEEEANVQKSRESAQVQNSSDENDRIAQLEQAIELLLNGVTEK